MMLENEEQSFRSLVSNDKSDTLAKMGYLHSKILYIYSQSPYCIVVFDEKDSHEPKILRATMKEIEDFSDGQLLRIHRSYLINPSKAIRIQKRSERDLSVCLEDRHHNQKCIPISRYYLNRVRKRHAEWFPIQKVKWAVTLIEA